MLNDNDRLVKTIYLKKKMDAWCFLKISKSLNHHVENYFNHNIKDLHYNIKFYVIITINMFSILHKSHLMIFCLGVCMAHMVTHGVKHSCG